MGHIKYNNLGAFNLQGDLRTWLLMLNLYYDFDFKWKNITPFVTAGAGVAWHKGEFNDASGLASMPASDDATVPAWQLGGGVKYRFSPTLAFTGHYRYLGTSNVDIGSYDIDFSSHEFLMGLEYDIPVEMFK